MLANGPFRLLLRLLRLTKIHKRGENVLRIDASLTDEQLEQFLRRQLGPFGSVKAIRLMPYVADDHRDRTDDGPFRLARHEAPGQHVDPLEDPHAANEEQQDTGYHHDDFHGLDSEELALTQRPVALTA